MTGNRPQRRAATSGVIGVLVAVSQVLVIVSRLLDGDDFFSGWVLASVVIALAGLALAAVALLRARRSRDRR